MAISKTEPLIGAHVSVAGGLVFGVENAKKIGAEAIQIFGSSPRQWHVRMPPAQEIQKYKEALDKSTVKAVFLHAPYLVNLATSDAAQMAKSIHALSAHFQIAENIGAQGLIFHIGSGKELPKEQAFEKVMKAMKKVLDDVPGSSYLIIENSAGGGQKIGSNIDDIKAIMDAVGSRRVKACIDTAHAFEAGIIEHYSPEEIKDFFDEWDTKIGIEHLAAFHVNDSKTAFNSHHDRHENIGQGFIGLKGFENLAREKRLYHAPWLLEVPGFDNFGPDKKNVDILKKLFL
ncbi:deoxyribonuclease IV [Candidatus Uhrbacteria bacterium]|nr:deoxyribonuclease IV [Candidatus Uhrbacteria bacterium]